MDRVQVLIEKLLTQKAANESSVGMLVTVQLLHQELLKLHQDPYVGTSRKVAVILPSIIPIIGKIEENKAVITEVVEKKQEPEVLVLPASEPKEERPVFHQTSFFDVQEPVIETPQVSSDPIAYTEPVKETYVLKKPSFYANEPVKEDAKPQSPNHTLPFDVLEETPTLSQRQPQREIHELIGSKEASLNDKLKQDKTELANVLKDAPIKDLRKGIGVNDKFLFINELFRGDEGLYERSIKTINAFHILPEAEYWINRELKIKLGWNDDKDVVQYFYQLVKRRFS